MKESEDSFTVPKGASEPDEAVRASSQDMTHSSNPPDPSDATTLLIENLNKLSDVNVKSVSVGERFIVEKELGRGGIGVTYLATDKENSDCQVAIKVLRKPLKNDRAWIERHFRNEVVALSRIDHPGVVKLISSGNTPDGEPYLVMEFVEGCDLRSQIIAEKGLGDFGRTAAIIRQLGEAISAAHDKGIYHRDLKPENIMIQAADVGEKAKVIDFGIATVKESLDEKTKTTELVGSVRYMAPEQILGKPTRATDIYALGIIAYEMITGRVPFNPDLRHPLASLQQLLDMQRTGVRVMPKDLRPSLPERAQEVILKALEFDKANRYDRADEFGAELAEALSQEHGNALYDSFLSSTQAQRIGPVPSLSRERTAQEAGQQAKSLARSRPRSTTRLIGLLAGLLIAVTLLLFASGYFKSGQENEDGQPSVKEHTLSYWALAQKYNEGRPEGAPTRLLGREMYFEDGDMLQFFVTSSSSGHLYLLSEKSAGHNSGFFLLFPTPKANNGSSQIKADFEVTTDTNFFDAMSGTEKVWIVWSVYALPELEDEIIRWADKKYLGEITEPNTIAFIRNLIEEGSRQPLRVEQDDGANRMNVKGRGDMLVRLVSLAHR